MSPDQDSSVTFYPDDSIMAMAKACTISIRSRSFFVLPRYEKPQVASGKSRNMSQTLSREDIRTKTPRHRTEKSERSSTHNNINAVAQILPAYHQIGHGDILIQMKKTLTKGNRGYIQAACLGMWVVYLISSSLTSKVNWLLAGMPGMPREP